MREPIIAITMGDPGGIGPEVIAKSLADFKGADHFRYVLIGVRSAFDLLKKCLQLKLPLHPIDRVDSRLLERDGINFLDISKEASVLLRNSKAVKDLLSGDPETDAVFEIGKISAVNASMALAAVQVGGHLASMGSVEALVTAPINKTSIRLLDPHFSGHTEFLASLARVNKFAMMFVSDRLRVTLVTIHVPIREVSHLITEKSVLEKIRLTNYYLKTYFNISEPKLAVCALNPHGREAGADDEVRIEAAVQCARAEKICVVGPLSADQLFYEAYEGRFDALISMYHDQGLAPFKMISFRSGVNTTIGLPYIRTSPDHGTAFDIAYQGKADPSSMKAALDLAKQLLFPQNKN
jgi:4-hydroxythreonine-4-phosphate dehydrogenase